MERAAIGIDLGGSHVSAGVVDGTGHILEIKQSKIDPFAKPKETLDLIADTVQSLTSHSVVAIGIGVPGNHDSERGICKFSPNFPAWRNVRVTDYLSKRLGFPVHMLNDVRVATLGEFRYGSGKKVKNLVMLAIGTGIGGGVIVNEQLLIGPQESAGEIGHMTIDPNGPLCTCGNHGCLEALASGPAIAARGADVLLHGQSPKLKKRIKSVDELTAKVIGECAAEGDKASIRILEEAGEAIGIAISNVAVTINPELFIVGGGVAKAGKPLFTGIQNALTKHVRIFPSRKIKIVPAALGTNAGLIGAASWAFMNSKIDLK